MNQAIEIHNLKKVFSGFTLGPLTMNVPTGAIYGFIGPNGAGKSTTIDLILGMGKNDEGTIRVMGFDHQQDEVQLKQRVGYVSPELSFASWGTIGKAIRFVRGFYPHWNDETCLKLLKQFKLSANEKIATLSFGAKTKLSVLMALAHQPDILIMDEPTTGLDAVSKQDLFSELLSLVREEDRTVLISSHGLSDLERFADHMGLIKDGKMIMEGRTDEIVEQFCMMDLDHSGKPSSDCAGIKLVKEDGNRIRCLVDKSKVAPNDWTHMQTRSLSTVPVTLEDLFVNLVKD